MEYKVNKKGENTMKKTLLLLGLLSLSVTTQAVELAYKTECIGSYTLDLPDNLEIALNPIEHYFEPSSKSPNYFADKKWAILSVFNYNRNILDIYDGNLNKTAKQQVINKLIEESDNRSETNSKRKLKKININNIIGYYSDFASNLAFYPNNHIYNFYSNEYYQGEKKDFEFYKQNAEAIINGFSTRELFELPQTAGKCIPFGFVAGNDASIPLILTVSFRLKEHPDIVISFTENTRSFTNLLRYDAKEEINLFWNSNYDISNRNIKNIKLLGFPIKYRDIKMDGRNGLASFVEIRYKDNSPSDYGYYAVVEPYQTKKEGHNPWLQLLVVGKQKESKGKTPLTKDEIYQIAKTIEASIKLRETEQ